MQCEDQSEENSISEEKIFESATVTTENELLKPISEELENAINDINITDAECVEALDICANITTEEETDIVQVPSNEPEENSSVSACAPELSKYDCLSESNFPTQKSVTTVYPDIISQVLSNIREHENADKLTPFTQTEMSALYYNQELCNYDVFVRNFVEHELNSGYTTRQPLHELLTGYLTCRDNLRKNELQFISLIEDYKQFQEQIWNCDTSSYTEYGECQDGNPVSATHNYKVSHFNEYIYDNFERNINELDIFTTELYVTNAFNVQLYQIKIEHFVHSLCYQFSFLTAHAPIQLQSESAPRGPLGADFRYYINELKSAISVLFSFQRRPIKDDHFIGETRRWLGKLVSVLLRVSTANDHLFIAHHVMRCPAGVGKWASHYVQPPVPDNGSLHNQLHVDHLITTLAIILLPVEERHNCLQQMEAGVEENGMWVIVDSEGEDSEDGSIPRTALKENDLVSFLNQIPFAELFRQIILVSHRDDEDVYDINMVTDRDILRSMAIGTLLITLLDKGIANYKAPAYKQFCKRLSRLIKHTASYITDHWQIFRETYTERSIVDSAMLNRLQTEYNEFLLRVVNSLYTTHERIGWQYLATVPFGLITSPTLWRLYQYLLHTNNDKDVLMSEEFMESLARLPDNDIYYFLTTVTNMALCRQKQDHLFIQTVVLQLFQIGFVNVNVRDKCMKPARILIANLTSKHPCLISDLIVALKKDFVLVGKFSLYLFKELPISSWTPNQTDYLAFTEWLLNCPLVSGENNLTRYILSQLNWCNNVNDTDLFLSRDFHCRVAILVVKALYTYAEEITTPGSSTIISQGVRQMSSIVCSQTPEQILSTWAWQTLSKLKLHLLDQPTRIVRMALTDVQLLSQIPDLQADTEDMKIISNGINRKQSVSYYAALLMTNVGHSLPVICETCWEYCCMLLTTYRYSQVLHVLQLTLPYFIEATESLLKLEKFQIVIAQLLLADQTYMKMAKNLIKSDFPGPILSQFAALIQYHIENYYRYCLQTPNQMVELWLRILCSVWNENCHSVAYLLDKIISTIFTNDSLKQLTVNVLSELIRNISANKYTGGGFSSLVSWIGYGSGSDVASIPTSLLPRNSTTITHSPYFAFFALHLEEYCTQTQTGLWKETLSILASVTGKANVDNAVKKACTVLKLNVVNSNCLAIYRWSQYALEIPVEHPLLPLFWQQFFKLYLQRVPANSSGVCVGSKLFEGTVNGAYFRKIKRKLQECLDFYSAKIAEENGEKPKNNNLAQLYKTFLLWLEELRLQEVGLFLPAFSALYNANKLSEIINGNENLWTEYVDFDRIREEQNILIKKWIQTLNRERNSNSHRILCLPEDTNVVARILKRLQSYDKRLPSPELVTMRSAVPELPRDALIHKTLMLDGLAEHFQVMMQFTKSYEIGKSEQHDSARKLLEAFRQLYQNVDVEVKLYGACDTATPNRRRTVSTIHCAGPAKIRVQIREARLNKAAERSIDRYDLDFQRLMKLNVKKPSFQLTVACIVIELAVETLRKERLEVVAAGDVTMLGSLQDVGVSLFYKLASLYDSQIAEYFPTKLFLRKVVDKLGHAFISEVETECPRLLSTLMNNPKLSVILVPQFTPFVVSASTFVFLYRKVTEEILKKHVDFILDVITKFNVKEWLRKRSPRLADRSQFIEVLSQALKDIGSQPLDSLLPVHKILRRDLCEILVYDFPEHYGEILHVVLKYSAEEKFSCDVWFDVLNALLNITSVSQNVSASGEPNVILYPGLTVVQIRDIARKYASELRTLTFIQLMETANILGNNFMKERLQYGLYGLYPKYCTYLEPIIALHSMVGHAAVTTILYIQRGTLANKLCEQIWPVLINLFSPWITPYLTGNLHEPLAPWIQQLTDDRSMLLPWVLTDNAVANKMMATFVECLKFVLDALPASNVILSNVCQWYIANFAHQSVKEHILTVVQSNLITLNWSRYLPTLADLECMLKIVDQYLPVCHSFLGSAFIEIPWNYVVKNECPQISTRVHIILLHLLIKLANEPNLRQNGRVSALLLEAQQFSWHLVDSTSYEHVLNWFVMSYDPRVILLLTDEDWNGIDTAAFDLLQVAAGYAVECSNFHSTTLRKKQMFVKACVRMTLQLANRYKTIFAVHHSHMESTLLRMLDRMENVVMQTVPTESRKSECALLLSELLVLVNQPTGSVLPKLVIQVTLNWLTHRSAGSPVLQGLLEVVGVEVTDHLHLGILLEACLTAWFRNSADTEEYDWDRAVAVLGDVPFSHPSVDNVLVSNNQILSLYALTLKHLNADGNVLIFSKIIQWITCLKPSNDNESKLPLLWSLAFRDYSQTLPEITPSLLKLCNYFQQITSMKSGWALFGVIGMNKQQVPSLRCKVLCYAMNAFVLMKLSEENCAKVEETSSELAAEEGETDKNIALVSAECVKAVSTLDSLLNDKHYAEYRVTIDFAVRLVKAKDVSLSQGKEFIITLAKQLYTEGYIHAFQCNDL